MSGPRVTGVDVATYTVPTEVPESDGTLTWNETTVVVVHAHAGGASGIGFTYGSPACATVVATKLADVAGGTDALDVAGTWFAMTKAVRNAGRPGAVSMAIAAVDVALWDLKARLLELPLATLLGRVRDAVPVYGSGGFTSCTDDELADQLGGWVHRDGIPRVKMKVGTDWGAGFDHDVERVRVARAAIGTAAELFVDANGAFSRKQAVRFARAVSDQEVTWFEEPVSSDDLVGLHEIRGLVDCDVAAGEYGDSIGYYARMCEAGAVDVVQADVSRCAGITEWLRIAALAAGFGLQLSGHCAQSLHAHPACTVPNLRHLEYFADHARVDRLLFDGVLDPDGGVLRPDDTRPGHGITLASRAEAYRR